MNGPYLGYQPPNESMRERRNVQPFGHSRSGEPTWRDKGRVQECTEALADVREQYGDDALGYAIKRIVG